jgi:hypothetical protein
MTRQGVFKRYLVGIKLIIRIRQMEVVFKNFKGPVQ